MQIKSTSFLYNIIEIENLKKSKSSVIIKKKEYFLKFK